MFPIIIKLFGEQNEFYSAASELKKLLLFHKVKAKLQTEMNQEYFTKHVCIQICAYNKG